MPLLLPPPVPVDQLAEVGRLLAVFDDEFVLEELLGCGTLHGHMEWTEKGYGPSCVSRIVENEALFIHEGAAKCHHAHMRSREALK